MLPHFLAPSTACAGNTSKLINNYYYTTYVLYYYLTTLFIDSLILSTKFKPIIAVSASDRSPLCPLMLQCCTIEAEPDTTIYCSPASPSLNCATAAPVAAVTYLADAALPAAAAAAPAPELGQGH